MPSDRKIFPAWAREVDECAKEFGVDIQRGLSSEEVERRRQKWGWNELEKHPGPSVWKLIMDQFNDRLIWVLLA